ncbi:low temperature requirement protein A [Micromonospora sp. NPDC049559]|uniref:low temperature requirement protein A n=1 Tax=Micromonospora sp. NPDC049559 TaxID=3155923 RepID=UPI0034188AF8
MTSGEEGGASHDEPGRRVEVATHGGASRPELFFDLVFVYAFINIGGFVSEHPAPDGLLQGGLVLLLLWRSWAGYVLVGNLVRLDRGARPVAVFLATTAVLLVAVTIPEAFVDTRGGLAGGLVFVVGFLAVRVASLLTITLARRHTDTSTPVRRAWPPLAVSGPLLLLAALLPTHLPAGPTATILQLLLFAVATGIDYLGLRATGTGSWQVMSVRHWAERHKLIILIALGETIISIGTSRGFVGDQPITWSVLASSGLGLVVVAYLWWAYFDIAPLDAEQALRSTPPPARTRLARDAYTLLHLPMIAGLVLVALGLKHALAAAAGHVAGGGHGWMMALHAGIVLYLVGLMAFEWRTVRRIGRGPLLGIVLVALLAPVARRTAVLESLAILAAALVCVVLAHVTVLRRRHRQLHLAVSVTAGREVDVTPEELFLDLVYVYAFIQVTALMARQPEVIGMLQGLAVIALLWLSWTNYTWYTTIVRGTANVQRLIVLAAVALILMLGIAAPQAFARAPGGLPGPVIVVVAYLAARALTLAALWLALRRDPTYRAPVTRAVGPTVVGAALLLSAVLTGWAGGDPTTPATTLLWVAALAVDLGGGYLIGSRNWQLPSVNRWMGRYNLIVLIALGQAIISTGMAVGHPPISGTDLLAVALSAALLFALWWTYVGTDVVVAHRFAALSTPRQRGALGRDAYAYLHLFLVAGLVMVAFGLRTSLSRSAEPDVAPMLSEQATLVCGLVVFLVADHLVWRRAGRAADRRGLTLLVAALAPVTVLLPVLWALVVLTLALSAVQLLARATAPRLESVLGDGA